MENGATYFARLSHELLAHLREPGTSQRIADRALQAVPGCDLSTVAVRVRRAVTTVAVSAELAAELDAWQYELDEGPCLTALATESVCRVDDVRTDGRWPAWSERARAGGASAVLSLPLAFHGRTLGTLNLYAHQPSSFDAAAVDRAVVFATHAAAALHAAQTASGLRAALESRLVIGMAQGILMQRYGLRAEPAFEVLRRYSSHANVKLRQVAQQVVERRDLPDDYPNLAPPAP